MNNTFKKREIQNLVTWYQANKRNLPWRDTGDPYHVWISEIMLQQTRIEAVIPKYNAFVEALPNITSLANVADDTLMRLWEGMGYYSRARNLKKCAKILIDQFSNVLPEDYEQLILLPGIGPYTAGAIASIAYNKPVYAIDGNVMRVLSRRFGIQKDPKTKVMKQEIENILSLVYKQNVSPSDVNQGLMEIGEVICTPNGLPHCDICLFKRNCFTRKEALFDVIPASKKKITRKILNRTILVIRDGNRFILRKRKETGLLANLYEFIGIDQQLSKKEALIEVEQLGFRPVHISNLPDSKHIFSHLEWHMNAYEIQVEEITTVLEPLLIATKKELSKKAIPSAFKTYIDWYSLRD